MMMTMKMVMARTYSRTRCAAGHSRCSHQVRRLAVVDSASLCLFANKLTSGVVVNIGFGATFIVPVIGGHISREARLIHTVVLHSAVLHSSVAQFRSLLRRSQRRRSQRRS